MENIEVCRLLMVVGMGTVFVTLLIVIGMGKLLIYLVNRYAPEEERRVIATSVDRSDLHAETVAAIVSSVAVVTQGKGRVTNIERQ